MRAPISWLRDLVRVPPGTTTEAIAERWTAAGLNVERIEHSGSDIAGPVVVGRVISLVEEPQKNGKTIRWCRVDVGPEHNDPASGVLPAGRGIVCGAHNFAVGDHVVVALPGAVLPGGFAIAARKTYGHVSDGMICAEDELGLGDDHTGIIVLPEVVDRHRLRLGEDALGVLRVRDEVIEADITPDTGYCLSLRGLARETGQAFGVSFDDPYARPVPPPRQEGYPVRVDDAGACPLFVALTVTGVDPAAPTPRWMAQRLALSGMRSISLSVDVTNYVMLESGQPMHAYDADRLRGPIVVRRAAAGETLMTLDDQQRALRPGEDLLICDDSGPIGLAGVMGGATTELGSATRNIVLEAACFDPVTIGRAFRAHKLPSEASKRFERGVDSALAHAAAHRAAQLLVDLGGGTLQPGETVVGGPQSMPSQRFRAALAGEILGAEVATDQVVSVLRASGCAVSLAEGVVTVTPPTWRRDLVDGYDYVEEVGRKIGFERIGSSVPVSPGGRGLTADQRARRSVIAALAAAGFVEVLTLPFVGDDDLTRLALPAGDERLGAVRLANPLADTQPYLRTTLLPGLFAAVNRNTSRSQDDLALFEIGSVFLARGPLPPAPMPDVTRRPNDQQVAALNAALPAQPRMLAGVITGDWLPATWNGPAQPAGWAHAIALAQTAAAAIGLHVQRRAGVRAPWHPGRCAELSVGGRVIGWAGELHPTVIAAEGLPARTAAVEIDLDALVGSAPRSGEIRPLSPWPLAKEDVALVVDAGTPSAEVEAALREGAGALLESIALFDIYTGPQVGEGRKSLAYALRFRAPDRTLTDAEASAARDAAVAVAAERCGAVLRG